MSSVKLKTILFIVMLISSVPLCAIPEEVRFPDLRRTDQEIIYNAQKSMEDKNYPEAVKSLRKYIDSKSKTQKHYLVYFTMGNALVLSGTPGDALEYYKKALSINPEDAAVWQNMGRALYGIKNYDEAGDALKRAYRLTDAAETAYSAGSAYILGKNYSKAVSFIEPLVINGKSPDNNLPELLLRAYIETGKEKKAIDTAWKLLSNDRENPNVWKTLARIYIDKKDYQEAAAALYTYTALSAAKKDEQKLLYDLFRMAGAPLRAAMGYETLLDEKADSSLYEITAASYMESHKTDKAIEILKKGIDKHSSMKMQWMLAGVHYRQKDFSAAADAFEKCAEVNFKKGEAYLMAGYCSLYESDLEKAKASFHLASMSPDQRAEALKRLKDIEQKINMKGGNKVD